MFKQHQVANYVPQVFGTWFVLAALITCFSQNAFAIEREIAWTEDYEGAMQRAASTNTVVLLHFYGDYCPPCKLLDKKTFHDPALVSTMNEHLVTVKINADRRRDLAQKYQVNRWPTDAYLFPNGDELYRGVSNADPAVYCKTIERVALRHRDWSVERNSMAKAKERRQDKALAAHTPQIKTEPQINSAGSGRSIKTQEAAFSSPAERPELPKMQQATERPAPARISSRVIDNPYLSESPIVVPPARTLPTASTAVPQPSQPPAPQPSLSPAPQSMAATETAAPIVHARPSNAPQMETVLPSMLREPKVDPPTQSVPSRAEPEPKSIEAKPVSALRDSNPRSVDRNPEVAKPTPTNQPTQPTNQPAAAANLQVYAETIGLGGFCPVTLIESLSNPEIKGWVQGLKSCAVRHRGRVYYCASERARQTLLSDPDKYTPCLSGFDIVTLCNDGLLHDGKCEFGCIQKGTNRVFLFENKANYDAFSQNTLYYSRLLDNSAPERVANELNGTQIR